MGDHRVFLPLQANGRHLLHVEKTFLATAASFRAIRSFPDQFQCRSCFVKYSLSRSVSDIFTLLYIFILFFNCLLNLTTSLFTQEEGIRSYLGGAVITTIFIFCLLILINTWGKMTMKFKSLNGHTLHIYMIQYNFIVQNFFSCLTHSHSFVYVHIPPLVNKKKCVWY